MTEEAREARKGRSLLGTEGNGEYHLCWQNFIIVNFLEQAGTLGQPSGSWLETRPDGLLARSCPSMPGRLLPLG